MTDIILNFEMIGDFVWMSLKDYHKLMKFLEKEGIVVKSKKLIPTPKKRRGKN